MKANEIITKLEEAGVSVFKERTGLPLGQVQRNLEGKTDYATDKKLADNKIQIRSCHALEDGLILGVIEQITVGTGDEKETKYRPAFFDVFGNMIYRPKAEEAEESLKKAHAALWAKSNDFDAIEITREGVETWQANVEKRLQMIKSLLRDLK